MAIIFETKNFILESHEKPEIDRLEGGHVKISPKQDFADRTELTSKLAIELMRLTIIAGKAMKAGMLKREIEIGRINYQENGNWKPHLHVHLYCRAKNATRQRYGDPVVPGHKDEYLPLNEGDIEAVRKEIERLINEEEFSDVNWGLF